MKAFCRTMILLFFFSLIPGLSLMAQDQGRSPAQVPASKSVEAEKGEAARAGSNQAEKDEELELKQSAMVKKLAKFSHLTPAQTYWASVTFNFLIVAGLIAFGLKSKLPGMFRDRTSAIQKGMEDARRASAESAARLTEIESRLSRLDSDITKMRDQAEQDSSAEDQRLRAATESEKRKIVDSAEQEIIAASNAARRELKQLAAELAVAMAEKRISVSESADKVLVREFASHLDGSSARKGGN